MKRLFLLVTVLALAACSRPDPVDREAADSSALPDVNRPAASPTGGPPTNRDAPAPAAKSSDIPVALQGRWGLTPADCTSTRGDAKGLLTVGPNELRFYESRAVPAASVEASANSVSGDFAFTGEGQEWTKFQSLELQKDKLVRTERDPNASFTYARCD